MSDQNSVSVTTSSVTVSAVESSSSGKPPAAGPRPPLNNAQRGGSALVIALIVLGIYYVGTHKTYTATRSWLLVLGLLIVLCLYLGAIISRRPLGVLVSNRNLMSLSRFQMVAWSIVILSVFLTIAFRRIMAGVAAPLDIGVDPQLWALMGISTTSLVGTPLILQNKTTKDTDPSTVTKAATTLGESPAEVEINRQGTLYANAKIEDARVTDMFEGDEVGNTAYVDIAKVQMFLFTIIMIVAFCYQVYYAFAQLGTNLGQDMIAKYAVMPALSSGMIGLLGISHAGYLGSKTANHTPPPQN